MIKSSRFRLRHGVCVSAKIAGMVIDAVEPPPASVNGSVTVYPKDRAAEIFGSVRSEDNVYWQGGFRVGGDSAPPSIGGSPTS